MITPKLKQRLLMSSLGFIGLFLCILYSFHPFFKPVFFLTNATIICFALVEYYHLAQNQGFQPLVKWGIISSITYIFALAWSLQYPQFAALPSLVLFIFFIAFFLLFFNQQHSRPLVNLAITLFGLIYLTIPLSFVIKINFFFPPGSIEDGRWWLAYVLIVSKITDVGAYIVGKTMGKTKLAPSISPQKTIEGAWGGIIAALLTSLLFSIISPALSFKLSLWQSIWLGVLISFLAQIGDLAESILKRDAGVKDSSRLPGLGGILDVVDSLVFTLPLMYLLLKMQLIG